MANLAPRWESSSAHPIVIPRLRVPLFAFELIVSACSYFELGGATSRAVALNCR